MKYAKLIESLELSNNKISMTEGSWNPTIRMYNDKVNKWSTIPLKTQFTESYNSTRMCNHLENYVLEDSSTHEK